MARYPRLAWLYVSREYLLSFAVAFLFFFFLFFINQVLVMAEDIFSKKVAFWDVVRLIVYSLPIVVAFAFPFGSLVGSLMAVGRLSSDNELLAFGSLGVAPRQILMPMLFLGLAFSSVSFVTNDYFLPLGNLKFAEVYRRVLYSNPGLELEPYSVKRYENTTIITGPVDGRQIRNVVIVDKSVEGNRRVITADDARLDESSEQPGVVSLALDHVFTQLSYPRDGDRYDYTTADSMVYTILLQNISSVSLGGLTPSTMSSRDLWRQIRDKSVDERAARSQRDAQVARLQFGLASSLRAAEREASRDPSTIGAGRVALGGLWRNWTAEAGRSVTDMSLQSFRVELNRKFSMPVGCLVFAFFAFPVGVRARRSGRTVGFGIGLFVAIVYWGLLVAGQTFGVRMSLSPAFSMWFPDAVVLAAGVTVFLVGRGR
ncbi:MAG TPA: LptF/LptG family permease [Spirochaetia bacterium]|nr:LptF/LptG family permease [Spirochaetia bacterium]